MLHSRLMKMALSIALPVCCFTAPAVETPTGDWSTYLGPNGNLAAPFNQPMVSKWADAKLAWASDQQIPNGQAGDGRARVNQPYYMSGGYASPVLADGRVYLQYYVPAGPVDDFRMKRIGGETWQDKVRVEADDVIHCFDAKTGKTLWRTVYEKTSLNMQSFIKGGPSLTCCVGDGKVFAHVNGSQVFAMDAVTGKKLWAYKTPRYEFQERFRMEARKHKRMVSFNRDFKSSPTYVDGIVLFNDHLGFKVGTPSGGKVWNYGTPSNLIALDAKTGKEIWRIPGALNNSAHAVIWTHKGKQYILANGQKDSGVRCIEPRTGKVRWEQPVQDPTTVAVDGEYMVSLEMAGPRNRYYVGFRITASSVKKIWERKDLLRGVFSWPAAFEGRIYAESCPRKEILCIDMATGKLLSRAPAIRERHFGYFPRVMGNRVICGGGDTNELHLYGIRGDQIELLDDASIQNAWGYEMPIMPALADGRAYLRTHDRLICIDLRKGAKGTPLMDSPHIKPPPASAMKKPSVPKLGADAGIEGLGMGGD